MCELVSVIIPVYESEAYLKECVQSVQMQSYKNVEILLIDDGSTDGSAQICDRLGETYPNVHVFHQSNKGVSAARNKGIEMAHGEFVLFLDSDDYLNETIIHEAVDVLRDAKVDLCLFGFQMFSQNSYYKYESRIPFSGRVRIERSQWGDFLIRLYQTNILHCIGTKLYRKKILDQYSIRFAEDKAYYEDIMFCLLYIQRCNTLTFLDQAGYYYRVGNSGSLSQKYSINRIGAVFDTYVLLKELLDKEWNPDLQEWFYQSFAGRAEDCFMKESFKGSTKDDRFRKMFLCMNQWMNEYLEEKRIEEFLQKKGYYSIAVYGIGYMGRTLLAALKGTGIQVQYVIDKRKTKDGMGFKVYGPEDVLPMVDVVVVTAIADYGLIKETLEKKGINSVISLEEIIYSL